MMRATRRLKLFWSFTLCLLLAQCNENKVPLKGDRVSLLEATNSLRRDPDADNLSIYLPDPIDVKDWGQMGGSGTHVAPHGTFEAENPKILWSESIGDGARKESFLLAGPVGLEGMIYTIDSKGRVEARAVKTGSLLWYFDTTPEGKRKASYHAGGGVAVKGDKVFVSTPYGETVALERELGYEIWRSSLSYPARSAPTLDGERVYVTTTNNQMVAFDATTGREIWKHEGASETTSLVGGAAPAVKGRVVVVPYSSGELFALRSENGHTLWTEALTSLRTLSSTAVLSQVRARPVIYKGMVIALSQGDRMMAIDFRTGKRLWDKEIGGVRTPAVTDEFIFVLTNENHMVCLLRETGQVAWAKDLPRYKDSRNKKSAYRWAGPTMAGGSLVVAGSNGQVLFLNPENGDIQKNLEVFDAVVLSPIVLEGILFVLTDRGRLIAVQ